MNSITTENVSKKQGQMKAILHHRKLAPCIYQRKELNTKRTKVSHDMCIVRTVVGEKTCLGMK